MIFWLIESHYWSLITLSVRNFPSILSTVENYVNVGVKSVSTKVNVQEKCTLGFLHDGLSI